MSQSIIGHVEPRPLPVTVQREPEVGIAWEAGCEALGVYALGATPGEASANLGAALRERGLVDVLNVDREAVDALVAKGSESRGAMAEDPARQADIPSSEAPPESRELERLRAIEKAARDLVDEIYREYADEALAGDVWKTWSRARSALDAGDGQ